MDWADQGIDDGAEPDALASGPRSCAYVLLAAVAFVAGSASRIAVTHGSLLDIAHRRSPSQPLAPAPQPLAPGPGLPVGDYASGPGAAASQEHPVSSVRLSWPAAVPSASASTAAGAPAPVVEYSPQGKALGTSDYQKLAYGADGCPPNTEVTTADECVQALSSLGINWAMLGKWTGSMTILPYGCSIRERGHGDPAWHMNCASDGSGRKDLAPICRRHPRDKEASPEECQKEPTGKSAPAGLPAGTVTVTAWLGGSGRLGNAVTSLLHALAFAKMINADVVRLRDLSAREAPVKQLHSLVGPFGDRQIRLSHEGRGAVPLECSDVARATAEDKKWTSFAASFWATECKNIPASYYQRVAQELVVPMFSRELRNCLEDPDDTQADRTLVVHLRGGDMWQLRENQLKALKGQTLDLSQVAHHWLWNNPPCTMYAKILQEEGFTHVVVVTSPDRRHPCVQWLEDYGQRRDVNVRVQSGSLTEDSCELLRARNLVLSYSTYPESMALLSSRVRRIYSRRMYQQNSVMGCNTSQQVQVVQYDVPVNENRHAQYSNDYAGVVDYFLHHPPENITRMPQCDRCGAPC